MNIKCNNGKPFLSIYEYRIQYFDKLKERNLIDYFDSLAGNTREGRTTVMINFIEGYWVPGGAWPGNYGIFHVTDYRKYKTPKGRKRIDISPTEYDYVDSPDMYELVSYPLKTTAQLIEEDRERLKYSIYSIPNRFYKEYSEKLIITIGGQKCGGSKLTPEMLKEVISKMTPKEYGIYLQAINKIDIDLYPSVELPIKIRIDGDDDGALEALFDADEIDEVVKRISMFGGVHDNLLVGHFGFKGTD